MKVWVIRTNLGLSLTVPNYEFRKGQYGFYPMKLSRFAEKNEVLQKYQNFIRGTLPNWVICISAYKTFQKSRVILDGSRTLNFKNLFENGNLFHNKSFPKRILICILRYIFIAP